jgi:hypothetical protein
MVSRSRYLILCSLDKNWAKRAVTPLVETFRAQGLAMPHAKVLGLSLPLRNGLLAPGAF